jgi:hypothetical protein
MSEWLNYIKDYATKHNISYKQALRDASPSYKTRNDKKPEEIKQDTPIKLKRTNKKKVVKNITLKL